MNFLNIYITSILCLFNSQFIFAQPLLNACSPQSITASIGYEDTQNPSSLLYDKFLKAASGKYTVWPAAGGSCSVLKKPIILVEGYDRENNLEPEYYYNSMNYWGSVITLRNQGYDVIVLNFDDSKEYIQRNAFLLMELINHVNNVKVSNNELVVIGVSMGGLVARYCLAYMESQNINHQVRLFLSYDSPHKGANIPLGLQNLMTRFANNGYLLSAVYANYFELYTPAVIQMLKYHSYWAFCGASPATICSDSWWHRNFMDELKGLNSCNGYPKNCRNVAISLGAFDGTRQRDKEGGLFTVSGAIALDYQIGSNFYPLLGFSLCTVPTSPPVQQGNNGYLNFGSFVLTGNFATMVKPFSQGLDVAPGGYSPVFKLVKEGLDAAFANSTKSSTLWMERATFIPTISALDYNTSDQFYNIQNDVNSNIHLSKTPFHDIYTGNGSNNFQHDGAVPTSGLASWIVNQINNTSTSISGDYNRVLNNITINPYKMMIEKGVNNVQATNYRIESNANVIFRSGSTVTLEDGFIVEEGAEFTTVIENVQAPKVCSYTPNARMANELYSFEVEKEEDIEILENTLSNTISVSPNPFFSFTKIIYELTDPQHVHMEVVDITGRSMGVLLNGIQEAGEHTFSINGSEWSPGIYLCKFTAGGNTVVKRLVLVK